VLGIPSLIYAVVSLVIPFVHQYPVLIALSIVHGMLLGTFVPATLMIIFRNLPIRMLWLSQIYSPQGGITLDPLARAEQIIQISKCNDDLMPDLLPRRAPTARSQPCLFVVGRAFLCTTAGQQHPQEPQERHAGEHRPGLVDTECERRLLDHWTDEG